MLEAKNGEELLRICETEYDYGLSDPFMQLYRKQSS